MVVCALNCVALYCNKSWLRFNGGESGQCRVVNVLRSALLVLYVSPSLSRSHWCLPTKRAQRANGMPIVLSNVEYHMTKRDKE